MKKIINNYFYLLVIPIAIGMFSKYNLLVNFIFVFFSFVFFLFYLWYKKIKDKDDANAKKVKDQTTQTTTYLKELSPYNSDDKLPGNTRGSKAGLIYNYLIAEKYDIIILNGPSGCGKSSLLNAGVHKLFKEKNHSVLFIPELYQYLIEKNGTINLENVKKQLSELLIGHKYVLIDQFEELYVNTKNTDLIREIGICISDLILNNKIKVCISIRSDLVYLINNNCYNLISGLTGIRSNFVELNNLTELEATDIIHECVYNDLKIDNYSLCKSISKELVTDNFVKPVELQIICRGIEGDFTYENFKNQGGRIGILSSYIKGITKHRNEKLIYSILRCLCDTVYNTKSNPKTIDDLCNELSSFNRTDINSYVQYLIDGRLLNRHNSNDSDKESFSLIHDYLVTPILKATELESSKSEDATNKLKLYKNLFEKDRNEVIPFSKIWFIYKYANKDLKTDNISKKLFKQSLLSATKSIVSITIIIGILFFTIIASLQTHKQLYNQPMDFSTPIINEFGYNTNRAISTIIYDKYVYVLYSDYVKKINYATATVVDSIKILPHLLQDYNTTDYFITLDTDTAILYIGQDYGLVKIKDKINLDSVTIHEKFGTAFKKVSNSGKLILNDSSIDHNIKIYDLKTGNFECEIENLQFSYKGQSLINTIYESKDYYMISMNDYYNTLKYLLYNKVTKEIKPLDLKETRYYDFDASPESNYIFYTYSYKEHYFSISLNLITNKIDTIESVRNNNIVNEIKGRYINIPANDNLDEYLYFGINTNHIGNDKSYVKFINNFYNSKDMNLCHKDSFVYSSLSGNILRYDSQNKSTILLSKGKKYFIRSRGDFNKTWYSYAYDDSLENLYFRVKDTVFRLNLLKDKLQFTRIKNFDFDNLESGNRGFHPNYIDIAGLNKFLVINFYSNVSYQNSYSILLDRYSLDLLSGKTYLTYFAFNYFDFKKKKIYTYSRDQMTVGDYRLELFGSYSSIFKNMDFPN